MIPVSVALPYLQKQDDRFEAYGKHLAKFLKKHPNAEYFMFDGTHRATGAMLSANKIPAYLIKSDEDIKQLFSLRVAGKISVTGLKNNLAETMGVIEEHYHRTKTFWTLEEKVKSMISKGDIDKEMLEHYNNRKKLE